MRHFSFVCATTIRMLFGTYAPCQDLMGEKSRGNSVLILTLDLLIQVARAGRFGTKGLAITFVSDETDAKTLNDVQDRFEVNVTELPEEIEISAYSMFFLLILLQSMGTCVNQLKSCSAGF